MHTHRHAQPHSTTLSDNGMALTVACCCARCLLRWSASAFRLWLSHLAPAVLSRFDATLSSDSQHQALLAIVAQLAHIGADYQRTHTGHQYTQTSCEPGQYSDSPPSIARCPHFSSLEPVRLGLTVTVRYVIDIRQQSAGPLCRASALSVPSQSSS